MALTVDGDLALANHGAADLEHPVDGGPHRTLHRLFLLLLLLALLFLPGQLLDQLGRWFGDRAGQHALRRVADHLATGEAEEGDEQ